MVSLYWAFINDITTPESAKKGYGILIFGSQAGAVIFILIGNYLSRDASLYASRVPVIATISIVMFSMVALVAYLLSRFVKKEELEGYQEKIWVKKKKESVGFLDGLKVLFKFPYVGGIFGLVFFHEVISALMYFQMLRAVEIAYLPSRGLVNKFLFDFTLIMQSISCLFALLGTSFFQRRFGIRACLIMYPLLLGVGISFYLFNPTLLFITGVMIIAKGINYVLYQPAKEILYIPTTKAIKYKAKAWIDMFGLRSAKMGGSVMNKSIGLASRFSAGFSLILVVFWIMLSRSVGSYNRRVVEKGKRIG